MVFDVDLQGRGQAPPFRGAFHEWLAQLVGLARRSLDLDREGVTAPLVHIVVVVVRVPDLLAAEDERELSTPR